MVLSHEIIIRKYFLGFIFVLSNYITACFFSSLVLFGKMKYYWLANVHGGECGFMAI